MTERPDVVVVGAGIVGAACAASLARRGLAVVVLEDGFAGCGATGAAMGHLVVMDDSEAQLALTGESRRLWAELGQELPPECELDRCGTLWVAEDEDGLVEARDRKSRYAEVGIDAELLDAPQLREAEPGLRDGLAGGLLVPGDAVLYPPAAARWLLARAIESGARLQAGRAVEVDEGRVVLSSGERVEAATVVNAAGSRAPELTPGLPIEPRRGHLAITEPAAGLCRQQVIELGYLKSAHTLEAESLAFNVQPRVTGQLLVGSSRELVGWDSRINRTLLGRMLQRAVEYLPALGGLDVLRTWVGFRPATPDSLPLIGRWPETDGLWIAAGHEGLGITMAPATGELLADLVTGASETAVDPAPFAPARFVEGG